MYVCIYIYIHVSLSPFSPSLPPALCLSLSMSLFFFLGLLSSLSFLHTLSHVLLLSFSLSFSFSMLFFLFHCFWFYLLSQQRAQSASCRGGQKHQWSWGHWCVKNDWLSQFAHPKRPVLKCLFSSFSVFFPCLFLSSLSKFHFSLLFVHQPLFDKDLFFFGGGVLLSFFFVAFFFPNVCFFLWNKLPNIPFLKPKLISFSAFFILLFLFCFHGVCFCLSVLMLALLLCFFALILFGFVSCFAFRLCKKLFSLHF